MFFFFEKGETLSTFVNSPKALVINSESPLSDTLELVANPVINP